MRTHPGLLTKAPLRRRIGAAAFRCLALTVESLFLLHLVACAHGRSAQPRPIASPPGPVAAPWEIPPFEYASQRLFKVRYEGPDGAGGFRLTLRLVSEHRYRLTSVDPLGRRLWSLDLDAGRGVFLDHRQQVFCLFDGELEWRALPIQPFPLLSLPPLLLGRMPRPPRAVAKLSATDVEYVDEQGRRWTAALEGGALQSWTLWADARPQVWWLRSREWSILSNQAEGIQVRWREVVRESLAGPLEEVEIPPDYAPALCEGQ